jgi:hypothetical protein
VNGEIVNGEIVNGEPQTEDLMILAAVESLDKGPALLPEAVRPDASQDESATLARLYAEVLGLLPYELEPVAPSPGAKGRLMTLIHGDETLPAGAVRITVPVAAAPPRAPAPTPPPFPRTSTQEFAVQRRSAAAGAASLRVRPSRWPLALAAAFALAALGLSGWLYTQIGAQRDTIAELRQELSAERSRTDGALAQARQAESDRLDLRDKFALVTSPAVLVSPMRPMGKPPLQPGAHGVLFVGADHQHWYMALRGLEPTQAGKTYKLWFVADAGAVNAGSFSAQPGAPIELSSRHMPAGTKGIMVTLENDPRATAPAGPEILRAAAMYTVS